MYKHLFTLLLVAFSGLMFGQSVPNGSFESWTISNYENPQFFFSSNYNADKNVQVGVNAIKTNDAYHGNWAIKLLTVATGSINSAAYVANGNPTTFPAQGGIPFSQKPTGLRFYYKSNIVAGDTAIFFVSFKKNSAGIATYLYKIATTQTNYTLYNATWPTLAVTPDTVVFGAVSSNITSSVMPAAGNYLQIDSLTYTGVTSQPTNLNGDLEQWVGLTNDKLNGWNFHGDCQRTTDAYSGTYAVEVQTSVKAFGGGGGTEAGECLTGANTPSTSSMGMTDGLPYSLTNDTLVFYYKYIPADPTDNGEFQVLLKKNGVQLANPGCTLAISPSYQKVSIGFSLTTSPDTINFSFRSSKYPYLNSYNGSDLKVDNMYLQSQKIPISNFILPPFGCVGQPIQTLNFSGNMSNAWAWIMPGGTPGSSTAQNPSITYGTPGTKTISMIATNQFGSGSLISKTITINPLPNVSCTSTVTGCFSNSATLTASGATSYSWSTGATTSSIAVSPTVTTTYYVGGATAGCTNITTGVVVVPSVPKPDICMVTVDSTNTYNQIYWDKTMYPMLDSMIIYRQVSTNVYKRIGRVSKTGLSMFIDTARSVGPANGDPNISTYRYKIQVRDTCGKYGPMSLWHNTVYFTHTGGVFFWINNYSIEGPTFPSNPVQTYSLMVCPNPTISTVFTAIGITTGNQYTLNDPNYNSYSSTADWRVEADLGYNCTPTLKTMASKITKSRSNIQNNRIIGIKENSLSTGVHVYPNPTNGLLNVVFAPLVDDVELSLTNMLGQVSHSEKINKATAIKTLDLSGLSKGVYTLNLSNFSGKVQYKVVVE